MQLFYSGAYAPGKAQPESSKSIGGFISVSPIPNGSLNNIFPDITYDTVKKNLADVRLIVLTNETGSTITNINISTVRDTYSTFKIAAVASAIDNCQRQVFEKLFDSHSLPLQASLAIHESGNAIVITSMNAGVSIGVWIERDLDLSQFTSLDGNGSAPMVCDTIVAALQAKAQAGTIYNGGQLVISWT